MDIETNGLLPPPPDQPAAHSHGRRRVVLGTTLLGLGFLALALWILSWPRVQQGQHGIAAIGGPPGSYWIPSQWIPLRIRPWLERPSYITHVAFHTDFGDPLEGMRLLGTRDSVRKVDFSGRFHGPEMLPQLSRTFPALQELRISKTNSLSPGDCHAIQQMTKLRSLNLAVPVEPGGFAELARHPNARHMGWRLNLHETSEKSLRELVEIPATSLRLKLSPADFQLFALAIDSSSAPLPKLKYFGINIDPYPSRYPSGVHPVLPEMNVSMKSLQRLPRLTHLILSNCGIDDTGVQHLESMIGLQNLDLAHSQVTDAGCRSLAKLTNLHALNLGDSRITMEGVRELRTLNQMRALSIKQCPNLPRNAKHALPQELSKANVKW